MLNELPELMKQNSNKSDRPVWSLVATASTVCAVGMDSLLSHREICVARLSLKAAKKYSWIDIKKKKTNQGGYSWVLLFLRKQIERNNKSMLHFSYI